MLFVKNIKDIDLNKISFTSPLSVDLGVTGNAGLLDTVSLSVSMGSL